MEEIRGGRVIANVLQAEGVKFVAGVPGDTTFEVMDALLEIPGIQRILTRHEQGGVYMADGYARATGRPGVAIATKGPGCGNTIAAMGNAWVDSVPLVLLQGQGPTKIMGKGVLQEMPHLKMLEPVSKWGMTLPSVDRIPEIMRRAFSNCQTGKPGPVVVEMPMDVTSDTTAPTEYRAVNRPPRPAGDPRLVEQAVRLLAQAERPLIYVGAGVLNAGASPALLALAEHLGAPVSTTLPGKSAFPESHPLSLGLGGYPLSVYGTPYAKAYTAQADVVLAVGCSFREHATSQWQPPPAGQKLIQVDADPAELNKNYLAEIAITGDAGMVLEQMVAAVGEYPRKQGPVAWIAAQKEAFQAEWEARLSSGEVPINPYRVQREIMRVFPRDNTSVFVDAGTVRGYMTHYEASFPRSTVFFGGHSAMGWSLPASLGAKIAYPDRHVLCVIGDGSFGMTGMEVETAVRHGVNIVVVILNNQMHNAVSMAQKANFGGRYFYNEMGGNYAKVAEGLGAYAQRVDNPDEVAPALRRAMESGRTAVVEVMIKPMEGLPYTGFKPPYPGRGVRGY